MSQYECIWDKLKKLSKKDAEEKGVTVEAHVSQHKRIIRAVEKRKNIDIRHKFLLGNMRSRLSSKQNGTRVTFFLFIYPPNKVTPEML